MDCFTIKDNHTSRTSDTLERFWENRERFREKLAHRNLIASGWQPIETAPKDGTAFYSRFATPMRFLPYRPKSSQFKAGIKGRWQEMNDYGGWENTDTTPREWMAREDFMARYASPDNADQDGGLND